MRKTRNTQHFHRPRRSRPLLALSLAASLAAFGCTTNQTLGNGTPTRSGPELRSAPTSGVTTGGETMTPTPPPMTSSYNRAERIAAPRTTRRNAAEAVAILAHQQSRRGGAYLGVVSPGASGRAYESEGFATGQFVNPAMLANPQLTVNSSISSPPTPGISSGADGAGAGAVLATSGVTAGAVIAGATTTMTSAAVPLPAGTFAASAPLPTTTTRGLPTVTAAAARATSPTVAATRSGAGSVSAPIRLTRGTNGAATITNVGTTSGTNR